MTDSSPAGCAVLCSAGLDSAVLAAHLAQTSTVLPVYVRVGLAWEHAEEAALSEVLAAPVFRANVEPPVTITFNMRDVYPATHWAVTGEPPAYDTPDEDVYIVGRNIVLLSKAAILSRLPQDPASGARSARRQPVPRRDAGVLCRLQPRAHARPRARADD